MTEMWTRWEPIPNLAPKYYINEINFAVCGVSNKMLNRAIKDKDTGWFKL